MPLVEINLFHKVFLHHIYVVFTTAKPKDRDLINRFLPLFFHLHWKYLKIREIWVLLQNIYNYCLLLFCQLYR